MKKQSPVKQTLNQKIAYCYPTATPREREAMRSVVLRCRQLKIVHVIDQ